MPISKKSGNLSYAPCIASIEYLDLTNDSRLTNTGHQQYNMILSSQKCHIYQRQATQLEIFCKTSPFT